MASTRQAPTDTHSAGSTSWVDRYFHVSERGSTINTEIRAGVVTFFAMAYIILLNPLILGTSPDVEGTVLGVSRVAAVTAFIAGVMTILFGIVAKYPFGIAAGLGLNTLVAVTAVANEGLTWAEAMGLVVIEGFIIVLLAISGFRVAVFNAIPLSMKSAMSVGIGAFIAIVGFVSGGLVTRMPDAANTTVPVTLGIDGSIASWPTFVFVFGLLLCGILVVRNIPGGLFIGIVVTTVLSLILEAVFKVGPSVDDEGNANPAGWGMAVPTTPDSLGGIPDLSLLGNVDLIGSFTRIGVIATTLLIFTLLLANFFDAMGTMTGLGKQAKLVDDKGNLPGMKKALVVEGVGAVAGGLGSASSNTVFADSAAGIGDGARTGLANIVTGVLFLLAMFLTPLYEIVPVEAASPALVIVGAMMMAGVRDIDWSKFYIALPAFLTIMVMPFTYSIANGIGVGFIAFSVMYVAAGKWRDVNWLMWLISGLFVVFFAIDPIMEALG